MLVLKFEFLDKSQKNSQYLLQHLNHKHLTTSFSTCMARRSIVLPIEEKPDLRTSTTI